MVQLDRAGVTYEVVEYDHDPAADSYAQEAAEALGIDPSEVFKTLLVRTPDGEHLVAVVPASSRLDLKAVAAAAGTKKATMADAADAERLTGYVVGGISPFGQKRKLRTFIDSSAADADQIHVSGGRRGMELVIAPAALADVLDATFAQLAAS